MNIRKSQIRPGLNCFNLSVQWCLTQQVLGEHPFSSNVKMFKIVNLASIMQTCTFKDPLSFAYALIVITIPPILIYILVLYFPTTWSWLTYRYTYFYCCFNIMAMYWLYKLYHLLSKDHLFLVKSFLESE